LAKNKLIELLPRAERARLLAIAEPFDLVLSQVLCEPGTPTRHAYFPTEGFISLVTAVPGHPGVEVGMVGSEGLVGAYLALDVTVEPLHTVVQGAGSAQRVATKPFMQELGRSPVLRSAVNRYLYVLMAQLATASACLRFHEIEPRLARWLLMSQDRAHTDTFHVTQEFLAYMLGVRRVGITGAASGLRRDRLIEYRRGEVTILDRAGLEAAACTCYAVDRKSYDDRL
jgi:CRP-like cAMP-binding protein